MAAHLNIVRARCLCGHDHIVTLNVGDYSDCTECDCASDSFVDVRKWRRQGNDEGFRWKGQG